MGQWKDLPYEVLLLSVCSLDQKVSGYYLDDLALDDATLLQRSKANFDQLKEESIKTRERIVIINRAKSIRNVYFYALNRSYRKNTLTLS